MCCPATDGRAAKLSCPHSLNKDEIIVKEHPLSKEI